MSKMAAVDAAVRQELGATGRSADYQRVMGAGPAAAPGYGYDPNGIDLFLLHVANRLQLDTPPLRFDWRRLDNDRCLAGTLALLISHVEDATE